MNKDLKIKHGFTLAEVFSVHPKGVHKHGFTLAEVFSVHPKGGRKQAFTLAEVLITLGIIGVVAAMTLPTLINNARYRQFEAALKKGYSTLNQALQMYQAENGEILTPDVVRGEGLTAKYLMKKYLMKYIKNVKDCGIGTSDRSTACVPDGYSPEGQEVQFAYSTDYKDFSGKTSLIKGALDDGQFVINDGSLVLINNPGSVGSRVHVFIDVNGYNNKPNRCGYDLFGFQLMDDGKLLPMGQPGTTYVSESAYCSKTVTSAYNGLACTAKALSDKNYFKNLP